MAYITFPTPVNGFYDEALKDNIRGRVILYVKKDSNNAEFKRESFAKVSSGDYNNIYYPLAVTTMIDPLSISTSIRWEQGGNLWDQVKVLYSKGMDSIYKSANGFYRVLTEALSDWQRKTGKDLPFGLSNLITDEAAQNAANSKAGLVLTSAAAGFKSFAGSETVINIPMLEFTYPAEDFEASHMIKAWILLSYLLPNIGVKKQDADKIKSTSGNIEYDSALYEEAPAGYTNPMKGFSTTMIEGTFALDIGGNVVTDLVPTNVSVNISRVKVLSTNDYKERTSSGFGKVLKTYFDSFYTPTELATMKKCQETEHIPSVIKVSVAFDFAKKFTVNDYKRVMFNDVISQIEKLNNMNPRPTFEPRNIVDTGI